MVQVRPGSVYPSQPTRNGGLSTADWKMSDTGREAKFDRISWSRQVERELDAEPRDDIEPEVEQGVRAGRSEADVRHQTGERPAGSSK